MKGRTLREESERFWKKVDVREENECWNWTGTPDRDGYGRFTVRKDGWCSKYGCKSDCRAHRFSYVLHFREHIDGILVCHTCDNPSCVNPGHLFLGTNVSNTKDRHDKGRSSKGSQIGSSLFTEESVLWLRKKYGTRKFTYSRLRRMLEKKFGVRVKESAIGMVINGEGWKHVGGPLARKPLKKLTEEAVCWARRKKKKGWSFSCIARTANRKFSLSCCQSTYENAIWKKTWKQVK